MSSSASATAARRSTRRSKNVGARRNPKTDGRDTRAAIRLGVNPPKRANRSSSVPELPLVAPPIVHRLVGNPAVIGAIGQVVCRVPAAEEEVSAAGIADRPAAGLFIQLQKGLALLDRYFQKLRLGLDVIVIGERGIATHRRPGHPHHVTRRAGL